jgi:hypothetical protein
MLGKMSARWKEERQMKLRRRSNFGKTHRWRCLAIDDPHTLQMSKDENEHYLVKQQNVILEIYRFRSNCIWEQEYL